MIVAVVLIWVAAVYRWRLTLSGPVTLWRTSFTLAITLVAIGTTAATFPSLSDGIAPNLSPLVVHTTTVLAGGFVLVYLLTLSQSAPPTSQTRLILGAATALVVVQVLLWSLAPVHTRSSSDLGAGARSWPLLMYFTSYYAALMCVLFSTAVSCAVLAVTSRTRDHSSRVGLAVISPATLLGGVALAMFAAHVVLAFVSPYTNETFREIGNLLAPFSICGIGAGTLLFVVGPRVTSRVRMWRTVRALAPLHEALCRRCPGVAIGAHQGRSLSFRHERILIEIHDALQRIPTPPAVSPADPYRTIARALLNPSAEFDGPVASELLPLTSTREDDRRTLLALAGAYEGSCRA